MATAKKKPATAKSTSSGPTAPSAAAASSSASPSSTTAGGAAGGGSNKKKSPPSAAAAAAAPTAVAAAPSDKTNTTAKKDIASSPSLSPPPDETQMTRCTEKDVLLGRGKRVSEWPGNIHFRQVVNRYREEYATAERANKVKIAAAVIAAVQNVGGRFVREGADTANTGRRSWYVVSHDRAVEKTCQALREKEKANPPTVSPFVGGDDMDYDDEDGSPLRQKRSRLSPAGSPSEGSSPPRTKRKILQHQAAAAAKKNDETSSDDEETSSDDDDDDSSDSDDDDDSASTSEEEDRKNSNAKVTKPSPAAAAAAAAAAASMAATEQTKLIKGNNVSTSIATMTESPSASASPEEVALVMMNRLRSFWSTHGHAAVPPIWPRDQKLADWCIQQRQLHREITLVANNSLSSSPIRSNEEDSQQSAKPLEKESSSEDQKMAINGASEQNGAANEEKEEEKKMNAAVDKGDVSMAAAEEKTASTTTTATTVPVTTATATASTHNDHVNNKQQQQAEPYRRGSPAEVRRIEALNRLGFCWDYAAWHWEHQYQLLVAQVARPPAVAKQDETQQAAVLNKITGGNKSDDATEKGKSQDISGTQDDMKNDAMEVDRAPAKKVDTEQMDVDKESTPISNGNINETAGISENDNAVEIDQHDDGKKDVPTDDTQEAKGAAATSASPACHNQGVKDGILSTILTDDTLEWIDDQQDQYHNQGHHLVSKERRAKLQAMGIYF